MVNTWNTFRTVYNIKDEIDSECNRPVNSRFVGLVNYIY